MHRFVLAWTAADSGAECWAEIPPNGMLRIGRSSSNEVAIKGDQTISREHAVASVTSRKLSVRCLETARNPLFFRGEEHRQLLLSPGATFQIGATVFRGVVLDEGVQTLPGKDEDEELEEHSSRRRARESTYSAEALQKSEFGNAAHQIEILAGLPELIATAGTDDELAVQVAELLLNGIPQAEAAAVVQYAEQDLAWTIETSTDPPKPALMRVESRKTYTGRFHPSRRLMIKALQLQQSAMHIWADDAESLEFTISDGLGWAFAVPIRGEACQGWCLYVSGKGPRRGSLYVHETTLQGDLRFTELLGQFIGSIRQVRTLHNQRTQLSAFFSPKVIESLTGSESLRAGLAPAERDVTVLFCDLRGFSKRSEALQHDLPALLNCIRAALDVMANGVLELDGAIADFQGDAVLGFWGWPIPDADGSWPACRAALAIAEGFRLANEQSQSLLTGLSVGVGVAHGRALAGQIGTEQQAKIGVLGPVVDQGSRLEGLTRQLGVSICIDQAAALHVRQHVPPTEARTRLLARVRPTGTGTPFEVYELLPGETESSLISAAAIAVHESAVTGLIAGEWPQVRVLLKQLPEFDGPANFLRAFLATATEVPGPDWDGAIPLESE